MMEDEVTTPSTQPWYRRLPRWAWILIGAGVLILLLLVFFLTRRPTVNIAYARVGEAISAVYAPGTVLSGTQTVIASTAAARIVGLSVNRGSTVSPGQIVAQLDDREARLRLQEAEEELNTAQAQLAQVAEPGDPFEIEQARAQLAQAQDEYQRALSAVNTARAELRQAQAQLAQAQAAVEAAQARVRTARQNVEVQQQQRNAVQEQVDVAQAQVERALAELANARDALARQEVLFERGAVAERQVVEARTRVRAAEATVDQARANVQAVRRQVAQAEAAVDAAQTQVDEAQSGVDEAQGARAQAQAAINVARTRIEQAQAQAAAAREQIDAAQAQLSLIERGERESAVEVARSRVRAAETRVASAQSDLNDYTVRSLVSGTVSQVPVEVGDFAQLGAPIAYVVSTSELYVQADVDENDIGPVELGQTAFFTTDAVPDRTYEGTVTEVGASAEEETNTYPVEIRNIEDTSGLRVNLSVDVNIVTDINRNALLVPGTAVVSEPEPHVWIVGPDNRISRQDVVVGARDTVTGRVEIRAGLAEGTPVVENPQEDFSEGQRVNVER